jgi:hypothetical protein
MDGQIRKTDIGVVVEETAEDRARWRRVYLLVVAVNAVILVLLALFSYAYSGGY